jgi:hypothetical protein
LYILQYIDLSIDYSLKFYSSPERPGVGEKGKHDKLKFITAKRGGITTTAMEEKRGTGQN